jgi:hypothetical protein
MHTTYFYGNISETQPVRDVNPADWTVLPEEGLIHICSAVLTVFSAVLL